MFVLYLIAVLRGHFPVDVNGRIVSADFSGEIAAARMIRMGMASRLYDIDVQLAVQRTLVDSPWYRPLGGINVYELPPFIAFAWSPFSMLPFGILAVAWLVVTAALVVASLLLVWPLVPRIHSYGFGWLCVVVLASGPGSILLVAGQITAVALFILAAGLRLLSARRDVVAGAVLGFGAFEPQLFFLVPALLLFQRRRGALLAWSTVVIALVVFSFSLIGVDGTKLYVSLLSSKTLQSGMHSLWWQQQSPPSLARGFLPGVTTLPITILSIALGMLALFLVPYAKNAANDRRRFVLLYAQAVLLMSLFSPDYLLYDCLTLAIPILVLINESPSDISLRFWVALAYLATWSASLRFVAFGHLPFPLAALAGPFVILPLMILVRKASHLLSRYPYGDQPC